MGKFVYQWKDPDYSDGERCDDHIPTKEEQKIIRKLGIGEYLVVDIDTDLGLATVRGRNT